MKVRIVTVTIRVSVLGRIVWLGGRAKVGEPTRRVDGSVGRGASNCENQTEISIGFRGFFHRCITA